MTISRSSASARTPLATRLREARDTQMFGGMVGRLGTVAPIASKQHAASLPTPATSWPPRRSQPLAIVPSALKTGRWERQQCKPCRNMPWRQTPPIASFGSTRYSIAPGSAARRSTARSSRARFPDRSRSARGAPDGGHLRSPNGWRTPCSTPSTIIQRADDKLSRSSASRASKPDIRGAKWRA